MHESSGTREKQRQRAANYCGVNRRQLHAVVIPIIHLEIRHLGSVVTRQMNHRLLSRYHTVP